MMRTAKVFVNGQDAGWLKELDFNRKYSFEYLAGYMGEPVSLRLPKQTSGFVFDSFPPFFEGLLPEGYQLEGLLKNRKIDRNDYFSQLMAVGDDLVGQVTVKEVE